MILSGIAIVSLCLLAVAKTEAMKVTFVLSAESLFDPLCTKTTKPWIENEMKYINALAKLHNYDMVIKTLGLYTSPHKDMKTISCLEHNVTGSKEKRGCEVCQRVKQIIDSLSERSANKHLLIIVLGLDDIAAAIQSLPSLGDTFMVIFLGLPSLLENNPRVRTPDNVVLLRCTSQVQVICQRLRQHEKTVESWLESSSHLLRFRMKRWVVGNDTEETGIGDGKTTETTIDDLTLSLILLLVILVIAAVFTFALIIMLKRKKDLKNQLLKEDQDKTEDGQGSKSMEKDKGEETLNSTKAEKVSEEEKRRRKQKEKEEDFKLLSTVNVNEQTSSFRKNALANINKQWGTEEEEEEEKNSRKKKKKKMSSRQLLRIKKKEEEEDEKDLEKKVGSPDSPDEDEDDSDDQD